ncbi:MAG: ATP-binding protein [Ferruginibacter sp.]
MLGLACVALFIFHYVRIRSLKNRQALLESQLLERKELLVYSSMNEQKATDKAALADRNKGLLMSRINHELRTPMNGVLGMAGLLKETDLSNEQKEYTNEIINSGDKLMKVINEIMMNDVLEYSKVDSGKDLEAKDIDLGTCIEEVLDVFAAKAAAAGIDLLYYIEENVPQQVVGDVRRLRQILMNLVENSMTVTRKGEIFIGVRMIACKEDNRIKLEFEIRDTGAGMKEEQTKLLARSLNMQNGAANTETASGVGLIISKKLVTLMGGSIQLKSVENEGTTVKFSMLSKPGMQPVVKQKNAEMTGLKGKKILIVDDNATARDIWANNLITCRWKLQPSAMVLKH